MITPNGLYALSETESIDLHDFGPQCNKESNGAYERQNVYDNDSIYNFVLDGRHFFDNITLHGVVAQLGEHLSGRQEVTGSIPVNSTIFLSGSERSGNIDPRTHSSLPGENAYHGRRTEANALPLRG